MSEEELANWQKIKDPLNKGKPDKFLYPDQDAVRNEFIAFILPFLEKHPFFHKVWIWASLAKGQFGVYEEVYREMEASDVDLLVEVNEEFEPPAELKEFKDWTKTRTYSRAFFSKVFFVSDQWPKVKHKVDFICQDVGKFLLNNPEYENKIHTIVIDPPRAGISPKSLRKVIRLNAKVIVYVSCNPSTQARDLETLSNMGYSLSKFSLVDQFPHTAHVESIMLFKKD